MARAWMVLAALLSSTSVSAFHIVLDPGHGGTDPGAVGCGLEEAEINLDVALRLKTLLETAGQQVSLTRTTDATVSLSARTDFANSRGATRFASIHSNSFSDPSANGTETYCHTSLGTSADLRDRIQREMIAAWGLTDRGAKVANFFVLANTTMPATLSELGFVSNCAVDATFLADDTRRGQAAEAHLRALADHLAFETGGEAPPADGELRGVVFHDQGVGTADMSVRIPGATVRVVGRDDVAIAEGDSASWMFTLPAGEYTLRAEAQGFSPSERTCTLPAGAVQFCSIGLFPVDGGGEEEGEGEGEGEDAGEGEGEAESEGQGKTEGAGEDDGAGVTRVILRNRPAAEGGCTCVSSSDVGVGGVLLLGLTLRRRRRARLRGVLWIVALAVGVPARAELTIAETPSIRLQDVDAPLRGVTIARGPLSAALPSPDGTRVLLSDAHYEGLVVLDVATGAQTTLSTAAQAGFRALWVDNDDVAHRVPQAPFGGHPLVQLRAKDGAFVGPFVEHARLAVRQTEDDAVVLGVRLDDQGTLGDPRRISPVDDRCFAPQLRRDVVVFQCLASGVWLHRLADGSRPAQTVRLGAGAQPTVTRDGTAVAFVVTRDEGHVLTESDVVVVDLRGPAPRGRRFVTPHVIERAPALSDVDKRGRRIFTVLVDDAVVLGTLP